MKPFFLSIIYMFFCYLSYSQDWVYVGNVNDPEDGKSTYFLKSEKAYSSYGELKVWVKTTSQQTKIKKNGKYVVYKNTHSISMWKFDCKELKISICCRTLYSSNGSLLLSGDDDYFSSPSYAVPGSIGEHILEIACKMFN